MNEFSTKLSKLEDWDANALSRLVGNDPAIQRKFLHLFLTTGKDKLNLIQAATASSDTGIFSANAHDLKSSARSVGAVKLGELCAAIEFAAKTGDIKTCLELIEIMPSVFERAQQLIEQTFN